MEYRGRPPAREIDETIREEERRVEPMPCQSHLPCQATRAGLACCHLWDLPGRVIVIIL